MSDKPRGPDGWRELLNEALPARPQPENTTGSRRERRRARKAAGIEHRWRTREAIDAERRREPVTAGGAALLIVAILAVGAGARWLSGEDYAPATPAVSPSAEVTQAPSPPPAERDDPPAARDQIELADEDEAPDLSDPEQVAREWASAYLTRNPPEDQGHTASVERAAAWMTEALALNLAEHDDPLYHTLVSRGGVSEVTDVTVETADPDLGTDTPVRVWRQLSITVEVQGYTDYTDTHEVQAEIIQADEDAWLVARVLGL